MRIQFCGIAIALYASISQAEPLPAVDCILNPSQEINLSSYVPGVITQVHVSRGQKVSLGDPVAQIDSRVEIVSVTLAQARAAIQSELDSSRINLGYDRLTYKRLIDLYSSKAVSEQDKEQTERAVKLSSISVKQARELRRIRELELKHAEALLEQRTVRSPIAGVIQRNLKHIGEYVDEEPIVRVVSLDPLFVETMMPIQYFGKIKQGMKAQVFPEISPESPHEAFVVAVDPVGDVGSSAFGVQLTMANPENKLPAGIKCDLRFLAAPQVVQQSPTADLNPTIAAALTGIQPPIQHGTHPDIKQPSEADLSKDSAESEQTTVTQVTSKTEFTPEIGPVRTSVDIPSVSAEPSEPAEKSIEAQQQVSSISLATESKQAAERTIDSAASLQAAVALSESKAPLNEDSDVQTSSEAVKQVKADQMTFGPYAEEKADQLMAQLTAQQVPYTTEVVEKLKTVGYIALIRGESAQLPQVVKELKAQGLRDVEYMTYGRYKGTVSLGVFYDDAAAKRRVDEIAAFGYQAEAYERRKRRRYISITVDATADDVRLAGLGL